MNILTSLVLSSGQSRLFPFCSMIPVLTSVLCSWTRGTGLTSATNTVAQQVESYGCRTFSAKETAFNILSLMHPLLFRIAEVEPIWADLNGGMDRMPDLADVTAKIRADLNAPEHSPKSISCDSALDYRTVNGLDAEAVLKPAPVTPRANFKFESPKLESPETLGDLSHLKASSILTRS